MKTLPSSFTINPNLKKLINKMFRTSQLITNKKNTVLQIIGNTIVAILITLSFNSCGQNKSTQQNKSVENQNNLAQLSPTAKSEEQQIPDNNTTDDLENNTDTAIEDFRNIDNPNYQHQNEELIYYFETNNKKMLSVCMDINEKYIVYRFGTADKVEMEFPDVKDNSSFSKFAYSGYVRHGGEENEGMRLDFLTFYVKNYKYIIYDTYYAVGDQSDMGIKVINTTTNKTTDIKANPQTQKGLLSVLQHNEKVKKSEALY